MTLEVDVTDREAVTKAVARVAKERGGLEWVVYSARIVKDRVTWKMSYTEWDDVIRVNLTGGFNTARALVNVKLPPRTATHRNVVKAATPWLWKSPRGRLVFIGEEPLQDETAHPRHRQPAQDEAGG